MRWLVFALCCAACNRAPTAAEIADRGWRAHEIVVTAGERAPSCAAAGEAMQRAYTEHRQAFVDAVALDADRQKLVEATEYLEAHQDRYRDLETRMIALADRCATDTTVQRIFALMESP